MARYHQFKVWKLAMNLVAETHKDLVGLRGEADLKDQIKRSSRSIVANICEGSERRTDKELRHFLCIARASSGELQSWYEMAAVICCIKEERAVEVIELIDHLGRSLSRFIAKLHSRAGSG